MVSSEESAIEPGPSCSNVSPAPKAVPHPDPIPSQPSNGEPPMETGHKPANDFYAGAHRMPPMPYNGSGVYTGQPLYYPPPPPPNYPPPPPNYPPYDDYLSPERRRYLCMVRVVSAGIALFIVVMTAATISRNFYQPTEPSISIASANLTAPTFLNSTTIMSFDLTLAFLFHNANKGLTIYYGGGMDVDVCYRQECVQSHQPPFGQGAESDKVVQAEVVDTESRILASTMRGINEDLIKTGEVEFEVSLQADMSFNKFMGFLVKSVYARCPSVKIRFVNGAKNGGTLTGPSIICKVTTA